MPKHTPTSTLRTTRVYATLSRYLRLAKKNTFAKKAWRNLLLVVTGVILFKLFLLWWAADFNLHNNATWSSLWTQWDARSYAAIAKNGYGPANVYETSRLFLSHFPPLYPFAIRLLTFLSGLTIPTVGLILSFFFGVLANYLLYKLVLLDFKSQRTAVWALVFFNLYPTAYFSLAAYSEGLYLTLVIGALYALRRGQFSRSALWSMGTILTKTMGVSFLPILFVHALHRLKRMPISTLAACSLPAIGILIYLAINRVYFGAWFYYSHEYVTNAFSAKYPIIPFSETLQAAHAAIKNAFLLKWDDGAMMSLGWGAIMTLLSLGLTIVSIVKKFRWEYWAYSLTTIVLFASMHWGISNARYTLGVFPTFIVLGSIKNTTLRYTLAVVFGILLLHFTRVFTSGGWAF